MNKEKIEFRRTESRSAVIIVLWSLLIRALLGMVGLVVPTVRNFRTSRKINAETLAQFANARSARRYSAVFFCSSAGEYEQAKPMIERLQGRGDFFIVIIFFSQSGIEFARRRQEQTPFLLSPIDDIWTWRRLMTAFNPSFSVIIRHELWPAFIAAAKRHGPVFIADVSIRPALSRAERWKAQIRGWLMSWADSIFVIDDGSKESLAASTCELAGKIKVCGDSKYDRVAERQVQQKAKVVDLACSLDLIFGPCQRLVVGSAWPLDTAVALDAYAQRAHALVQASPWQVIIALHEPTPANLADVVDQCRARGLSSVYFSQQTELSRGRYDVVLIDRVGFLSELYGACHLAFVGGALHHKVHNVLEPLCYGLPIAFGPRYQTSHEAGELVKSGHATVVHNTEDLLAWWKKNEQRTSSDVAALQKYLSAKLGASDRILGEICKIALVPGSI